MAVSIAASNTNQVRPLRIGLCILEAAPPSPPPDPRANPPHDEQSPDESARRIARSTDPYLFGLQTKPLAEAYVVLLTDPDDARTARLCRTTRHGELVSIQPCEIGGPVPAGNDRAVFVEEDRTYTCFWTYDPKLFQRAIGRLGRRTCNVVQQFGTFEFEARRTSVDAASLEKFFPENTLQRSLDRERLATLFHNLVPVAGLLTRRDIELANQAYFDVDQQYDATLTQMREFTGSRRVQGWVHARRPGVAAIYLAEFLTQYAVRARSQSAWDYDQLHAIDQLIEWARKGGRLEHLDAQVKQNKFGEEYVAWALRCATASPSGTPAKRIEREEFGRTLYSVLTSGGPWREVAKALQGRFGVRHPSFEVPPDFAQRHPEFRPDLMPLLDGQPFVDYFEFYRYPLLADDPSRVEHHGGWCQQVPRAEARICAAIEAIRVVAQRHFAERAPCIGVWLDIGWHVRPDEREQLQARYLDATEDVGHSWWDGMPEVGEEQEPAPYGEDSEEVKAVIMTGFTDGTKQAEIFDHFFGLRSRTVAARVTSAVDEFKRTYRKIRGLDRWILKTGFKEIRFDDITVEAKLGHETLKELHRDGTPTSRVDTRGKLIIRRNGELVGEMDFELLPTQKWQNKRLGIVEPQSPPHGHGGGPPARGSQVDYGDWPKGLRDLEDPRAKAMKVPMWFASICYAVIIGVQIRELKKKLERDESVGFLAVEIGTNTLFLFGSLTEAVELTLHGFAKGRLSARTLEVFGQLGKAGRVALKVAIPLEIILDVKDGVVCFMEASEEDEIGRSRRAVALQVKGTVLVVGAGGAVAAWLAVGLATGGLVLAATAIVAGAVQVYIWIAGEPDTPFTEAEKRLVKILDREFGYEHGRLTTPVCRTFERLSPVADELERVLRASSAAPAAARPPAPSARQGAAAPP